MATCNLTAGMIEENFHVVMHTSIILFTKTKAKDQLKL